MVEGRGSTRRSASCIEMEGGGNQLSGTHSIPVEVVYAKWNSAQGGTRFSSSTSRVLVTTRLDVTRLKEFLCSHDQVDLSDFSAGSPLADPALELNKCDPHGPRGVRYADRGRQ